MKPLIFFSIFLVIGLMAGGCTPSPAVSAAPRHQFTLRTGVADGRLAYIGVGGAIDGLVNPDLTVRTGDSVRIEVLNGDGIPHDLALRDLNTQTAQAMARGKTVSMIFTAGKSGVYPYICTVAGHRQAGMEGRLVVTP
jgi:nitrite reductase (NO-forming)